jgi:hypothetical protein
VKKMETGSNEIVEDFIPVHSVFSMMRVDELREFNYIYDNIGPVLGVFISNFDSLFGMD